MEEKINREMEGYINYESSESDDSYDSELTDEEDEETRAFEHVFLQPINAKTDVKATMNCKLLQMEKKHLNEMRQAFFQELGILLAEAQNSLARSLKSKLLVLKQKKEKKARKTNQSRQEE